ncbi:hypothetical protein F4808DRAFT_180037 [Astrocystis sublimbata]|nr:hypothetical protein F4808DRAFT_180037 [Astrocystis sublimbata]
MKFGERLEEASVPGWSLYNVDYNSLKHMIRAHTSREQATATAMAIPGQQSKVLTRFEDAFYLELCSQHNRAGLFVTSKGDEISRRLRHLSGLTHNLMLKCADTRGLVSTKRQRRLAKYQAQVEECGDEIRALNRFVDAQTIAFRKILKKYKKWTGSTTLRSRFKDNVLDDPKSFTHQNFEPLHQEYRQLRTTLDAASPLGANTPEPPSPPTPADTPHSTGRIDTQYLDPHSHFHSHPRTSSRSPNFPHITTYHHVTIPQAPPTYWNEYEHGSEAGDRDDDDAYVLYIDPNADDQFPGLAYVKSMFGGPVGHVRHWLQSHKSRDATTAAGSNTTMAGSATSPSETQSLLASSTPTDYFSVGSRLPAPSDDGYRSSSDEELARRPRGEGQLRFGHTYSYASSSSSAVAADAKMLSQYQDRMLTRGVIIAYVAAFVLLGVSAILYDAGRRRLRLEVDAGATLGVVASLFCACMGLGAMLYRQSPSGYLYCLAVWAAFVALCALNGGLLVLVARNSTAF